MRNPQNKRTWKSRRGEKEKVAVGLVAARENFEASATQLAKWTSLSSVYSNAVCANVVDSRTLQTSEYWKLCPHRRQAFWITTKARSCLFALRQKSRFLYVSLLWHVLTTRLSANHRTSERNNNSRLGTLIFIKNYPIFSKTLAVDKSFWTATNTSPTAWVKKGSYSTYGSWRHLFLC